MVTVCHLTPDDAPELTDLYTDYAWWAGRDVDAVRTALSRTAVAVGIRDDGVLVAGARVLSDLTYYATVFDVIVAADRRNDGVGDRLMREVVAHPALQAVDGVSLRCRRGLVPFYESVGFELFDAETEVPNGEAEEMVRMSYD